ncbi:uncharacterized protein B0H18DRAFT_956031 [Fomitopsis serialis]|uniref:uncharacterized protein n=1 Tax=Fomitopsis serialis TaxID=139415 RepID=UPI0020086DF6|nr:uncharacterized protein B0H18DRAFT_956031 [Neoantrodia serialis]KAH9922921.1 hypothetical protein B0H18DRAFT_956031 [Neoantrodia serialis]
MNPHVLFARIGKKNCTVKTFAATGAENESGPDGRMSTGTIIRVVVALVVFLLVFIIVICVAWPHHRKSPGPERSPQSQRRSGAHIASIPRARISNNLRRQPSAIFIPAPPYEPAPPSYSSLLLAPSYGGRPPTGDDPSAESISMAGVSPSLSHSTGILDAARSSAPLHSDPGAEVQLPPQAHTAVGALT